MWCEKLGKIRDYYNINYHKQLNNGATEEEIQAFNMLSKMKLGFDFPKEYTDILKIVNGLNFNGLFLYGIDQKYLLNKQENDIYGAIEWNLVWKDLEEPNYIFLGDENISWFVYDRVSKSYRILDKPSARRLEKFPTFENLFEKILDMALN